MSPETVADTAKEELIERGWAALPAEYRMPALTGKVFGTLGGKNLAQAAGRPAA
jgi:hypothetical protein